MVKLITKIKKYYNPNYNTNHNFLFHRDGLILNEIERLDRARIIYFLSNSLPVLRHRQIVNLSVTIKYLQALNRGFTQECESFS